MSKKCTCGFKGAPPHEDIYDCVEYQEVLDGKKGGQWMIDWAKKLKENATKKKSVGFKDWVDSSEKQD
mgnify:CR=1 FL=1|tara:strand:- start:154 stop:357 length:204 start_codon:yes stop_codon:yes gene_type:complete